MCAYSKKRANSTLATFLLNCSLKESILASFFKKLQTEVDKVCKNGNSVLQKQNREYLYVVCEEFVTELKDKCPLLLRTVTEITGQHASSAKQSAVSFLGVSLLFTRNQKMSHLHYIAGLLLDNENVSDVVSEHSDGQYTGLI
jgi:hypothetical protein